MSVRRLRLAYQPPYDFAALLTFLARRAIAGVEQVDARSYARHFRLGGEIGSLRVTRVANAHALAVKVDFPHAACLPEMRARVRRMFDLDADITRINTTLGRRPPLRQLVAAHPGQRLPGGWDGFEIAVRAVLGQQISVAAARTFAGRLVQQFGTVLPAQRAGQGYLFPTPRALADADLGSIGLTRARAQTLRAMAQALDTGRVDLRPDQNLDEFVRAWTALPGIGAWTAHYIAMRALHHRDAFPAADLVLRKAVSAGGIPVSTGQLQTLAEAWRPYRAYAVLHLWRSQA